MSEKWIAYKDKLPEAPHVFEDTVDPIPYSWHESDELLIQTKEGKLIVGIYVPDDPSIGECWIDANTYDTIREEIVAWMPCPARYKS